MAYNYNSIGAYGSGCGQAAPAAGLASYGQSLSSECIDFNSLGMGGLAPQASQNCCYQNQQVAAAQQYAAPQYAAQPYAAQYPQYGAQYAAQQYPAQYHQAYAAQSQQQQQLDVNDPQLLQQVDQIINSLNECKRPMLRRQVICVPSNCPGRVACITRRLPTPPPDIIERITVIKPPRDVVNLCIEKPCQPPPCFQQREICGKPRKPLIQPRVIQVAPRSNPCQPQQPVCPPCPQAQPTYAAQQQPVCPPCPQPQQVYAAQQQPVCPPCPQPVAAQQPQQVCVQPPPVCVTVPSAPQHSQSYAGLASYQQQGLVNSASGAGAGFYGYC